MFFSWINRQSSCESTNASRRRPRSERHFRLEPLEDRVALSTGIEIGPIAAVSLPSPNLAPADFGVPFNSLLAPSGSSSGVAGLSGSATGAISLAEFVSAELSTWESGTASGSSLSPSVAAMAAATGGVSQLATSASVEYNTSVTTGWVALPPTMTSHPGDTSGAPDDFLLAALDRALVTAPIGNATNATDLQPAPADGNAPETGGPAPAPPIPAVGVRTTGVYDGVHDGLDQLDDPMGMEERDPNVLMPEFVMPPMMASIVSAAKLPSSQADNNSDDFDLSFILGGLISMSIQSDQVDADPTEAESNTGRGSGSYMSVVGSGFSLQRDLSVESTGDGWMAFVAAPGWRAPSLELSMSTTDVIQPTNSAEVESSDPGSITAGTLPLGFLLDGSGVTSHRDVDAEEQVAELVPLHQSSLALVATLWTVSSDAQAPVSDWSTSLRDGDAPGALTGALKGAPASWTVFVTGLNQAFEQSQRDIEANASFEQSLPRHQGIGSAADDGLRWLGPIVPAPFRGSKGGAERSTRPDRLNADSLRSSASITTDSESIDVADYDSDPQLRTEESSTVAVASLPAASAITAVGMMGGWLWTQRTRWFRVRSDDRRGR